MCSLTITLWSPLAEPWTLPAFNDASAAITGQSGALVDGWCHGKSYNGHCMVFNRMNCDQDTILSLFSNCKRLLLIIYVPIYIKLCFWTALINSLMEFYGKNNIQHQFKITKELSNNSHFTQAQLHFMVQNNTLKGAVKIFNSDNCASFYLLHGHFWYTTYAQNNLINNQCIRTFRTGGNFS